MAAERSEKTSNHKFPRLGLAKTSKKIPSEMEVAPRYIQLTLLILLKLLKLLYIAKILACMPIYIVREG